MLDSKFLLFLPRGAGTAYLFHAAILVFVSSVAVAQDKTAPASTPNRLEPRPQAALIGVEKQTTECLSRALQDMYAKGWRGGSLRFQAIDLCPYPGLPVTVDDYAQLVQAQVSQFNERVAP